MADKNFSQFSDEELRLIAEGADHNEINALRVSPNRKQPRELIVSGGFALPKGTSIYSWVDENFPGAEVTKLPWRAKSFDNDSERLRATIEEKRKQGKEVVVLGHSLGSLLAYDVQGQYKEDPAVDFVFVDPPTDASIFGGLKMGKKAKEYGEALANDRRSIRWTSGTSPIKEMPRHDAFSWPGFGDNKKRLDALRHVIEMKRTAPDVSEPNSRDFPLTPTAPIAWGQGKEKSIQDIYDESVRGQQQVSPEEWRKLGSERRKIQRPRYKVDLPGVDPVRAPEMIATSPTEMRTQLPKRTVS